MGAGLDVGDMAGVGLAGGEGVGQQQLVLGPGLGLLQLGGRHLGLGGVNGEVLPVPVSAAHFWPCPA